MMFTPRKIFNFVIATLALNAICIMPTSAATYYVATNGSDSNPGTQAAPFRTIAYAVKKMVAGDTTYVRGGTYNEKKIWFGKSGTASAPIRLLNAPGESPKVNFGVDVDLPMNAPNRPVHRVELYAGKMTPIGHIVIEGFELGYGWDGIKIYNAHDVTIRRNWIHHSGQGILGNGTRILIDRNVISHNGQFKKCVQDKRRCNQDHGMYLTGSNYVITNNLIYDNLASGIQVAAYGYERGNSYRGPLKGHVPSSDYANATNFLIANNTIAYNNYAPGIVLWLPDAVNSKIINNILYENGNKSSGGTNGISFYSSSGGGGHTVNNNIIYASGAGAKNPMGGYPGWQSKYTGSGNMENTVNPNFEGAGATISGVPNFKLRAGSPAIDKGQSLSQVTWDHAGGKRPFGAAFDIGAYEFGSPPDSGSPPPNPTGGEYGSPGAPVLLGPNGEVCPTGYN